MAVVPAGYAEYLKAPARYVAAVNADAFTDGITSEIISPFALQSDAQDEATRQATFLGGPRARDKVVVTGLRSDLFGKPITVKDDRLGYEGAGAVVFVLAAEEHPRLNYTTLTVLKRL